MDQITLYSIILNCGLLVMVVAAIIMSIRLYKSQSRKIQQIQNEKEVLNKTMEETGRMDAHALLEYVEMLEKKKTQSTREYDDLKAQFCRKKEELDSQSNNIDRQIQLKKNELVILDEEILLQSFGFYTPKYDLENSEAYQKKLEEIRGRQSQMVKSGEATFATKNWSVNNSQREGERMIRDYVKLILRSFNNECDASVLRVRYNNIESIEKKIRKAFETLNSLGLRMSITISHDYLDLKLQEMYLVYEYQVKKQEEKEEQKRIREQMREEAKLLKEIEAMKAKIEKEEKHFVKALEEVNEKLCKATSQSDIEMLTIEKEKIEQNLSSVERNKQDVWNREQNTRAGYVYVISNIGSFGENVYKIGVTRRFDPTERVGELGDASVPFNFDIHATIFSDDAPTLEAALHKAFENRRLNMINRRREFFSVTLDEIEKEVRTNFSKPVEFVRIADAAEYRQSRNIKEKMA